MEPLAFKPSAGLSIGMEMEFQLLDAITLDLTDGILPLLDTCRDMPLIKPEFTQASVEINSIICNDTGELEKEVASVVSVLKERCGVLGMAIAGTGTHPFCNRLAKITPMPRFLAMERNGGYLGHTLMTYSLHVHLGMPSGEEAIESMKDLRPYLPILLALSASSPFWRGYESGYASYRQRVLAATRSYGLPPVFKSWKDFSDFFDGASRAGAYRSIEDIHWDIRPRPDMGTLEVRVMDGQPTVKHATALAAFVHTLLRYLKEVREAGEEGPISKQHPCWIERENHFMASRFGLEAEYILDSSGKTRTLRDLTEEIIRVLGNAAPDSGKERCLRYIIEEIVEHGPSYCRQRAVFKETASLKEVTASLVRELNEDPSP